MTDVRRLKCPKCGAHAEVRPGQRPVCLACGHGRAKEAERTAAQAHDPPQRSTATKFGKLDILAILKSSMRRRFQDMPPRDFEFFVAQLFADNGYEIEQVLHGGDYGTDVVASRDGRRTAIQVKRYQEASRVGVKDVNQAVGGRKYWKCDNVIFITTSSFTKQATNLASQTDVELWDWDKLQREISRTYLNGDHHSVFFADDDSEATTFPLSARIVRHRLEHLKGNFEGHLVYIALANETSVNVHANIMRADLVTKAGRQVATAGNYENHFITGPIYAGAEAEACFVFRRDQIHSVGPGDRVVLAMFVEAGDETWEHELAVEVPENLHVQKSFPQPAAQTPSGSGCFIATAAYGTPYATEIDLLRRWRDESLQTNRMGQAFIRAYYKLSPPVARFIESRTRLRAAVRVGLRPILAALRRRYARQAGEPTKGGRHE